MTSVKKRRIVILIVLLLELLLLIIIPFLIYNCMPIRRILLITTAIVVLSLLINKPWVFLCFIPLSPFIPLSFTIGGMSINATHLSLIFVVLISIPYLLIQRSNIFEMSLYLKPLLLIVAVAVVSFLFTILRDIYSPWVLRGTIEIVLLLFLYQLCILMFDSEEKREFLKYGLIAAGIWLSIETLSTYSFALQFSPEKMAKMLFFIRGGTFGGSPNQAAMFIELIIPLILVRYLFEKKLLVKILLLVLFFVMSLSVIATFSRAGIFTLLISSVVITVLTRKYKEVLVPFSLILFILLVSSFYLLVIARFGSFALQTGTFAGRAPLFRSAFAIIKGNWLIGIGMNNFSLLKYNYDFPYFYDPYKIQSAHNVYLEIFANLGILGLLGLISIFVLSIGALRQSRGEAGEERKTAVALFGSAFTFFFHGLVDSAIANVRTMSVFMIILALFAFEHMRTNKRISRGKNK